MRKVKLYNKSELNNLKRLIFTFSSATLLFIAGLFISGTVLAQQQNELKQEKLNSVVAPVDLTASFMTMFKGLAICILILLLVIWMLKKFKSPIVAGQGRKLKILERLPVTARSSLLLVEVNQKQLLVGVGADPISLVSDFVQADSMEELAGSLEKHVSEKNNNSGEKQ